jgi:hypothetical protein
MVLAPLLAVRRQPMPPARTLVRLVGMGAVFALPVIDNYFRLGWGHLGPAYAGDWAALAGAAGWVVNGAIVIVATVVPAVTVLDGRSGIGPTNAALHSTFSRP